MNPQWLDQLRHELRRRQLPSCDSARLLEELAEHLIDITKENPSMEAQTMMEKMGSPITVAAAAAREYRDRTFAGRYPILTFLIAPIPAAMLTLIAFILAVAIPIETLLTSCQGWLIAALGIAATREFDWIATGLGVYLVRCAPFPLTAWFFLRLARHVGRPGWGLVACGCVAYFAFLFRILGDPAHNVKFRVGLYFEHGLHQWQFGLLQAALPLALGLWFWRTNLDSSQGPLCNDSDTTSTFVRQTVGDFRT